MVAQLEVNDVLLFEVLQVVLPTSYEFLRLLL